MLTNRRAYNEFDDIPASVNPMLYQALEDWGFDGFTIADDTGIIISLVSYGVHCADSERALTLQMQSGFYRGNTTGLPRAWCR